MYTLVTLQKVSSINREDTITVFQEVIEIEDKWFIELEIDSNSTLDALLLLKGYYVKHHLMPFYDLLYDYEMIVIGRPDEHDRIMHCRHKRITLLTQEYTL